MLRGFSPWVCGWQVADSSLAEGRFKFFLGVTEWERGQLQQAVSESISMCCDPHLSLPL